MNKILQSIPYVGNAKLKVPFFRPVEVKHRIIDLSEVSTYFDNCFKF